MGVPTLDIERLLQVLQTDAILQTDYAKVCVAAWDLLRIARQTIPREADTALAHALTYLWPLLYTLTGHSLLVAGGAMALLCGIIGMKLGLLLTEPTDEDAAADVPAQGEDR